MSDKKGKELLRSAEGGDADAGAAAIVHGARRADSSLVLQAVEASVGSLDTNVLDRILYTVGTEIASREINLKAGRESYKAGELHMPNLGKVSLGRLVSEVVDFVEKLQNGDKGAGRLMIDKAPSWRYGYGGRTGGVNKAAQITKAKKALEQAEGIMVAGSSALRIYALRPQDPDKARKKIEKRQGEITKKIERTKKAQEQRLRDFEKEKKALEEELAAQVTRLNSEMKELEGQKENIKKEEGDV